jgi:hypothetical protein
MMDAEFRGHMKCDEQAIRSNRIRGMLPREQIIPKHSIGAAAPEFVRHHAFWPGPFTFRLAELGIGHNDFGKIPVAD